MSIHSNNTRQLFIAATRQNDGKTMVSLGLFKAFQKKFKQVGYMKPVGQQYQIVDDEMIDKDAILFQKVYSLSGELKHTNPITVSRGFTEQYIQNNIQNRLRDQLTEELKTAHHALCQDNDFLLIEGTGHAGVGSVFDMSNAQTAKILNSKVILVSLGGIGRCIDEIMLNKAVFDSMGVTLAGINKVREDKYDKVNRLIRDGLARQGITVFGCIPFIDMLIKPIVRSIFEDLDGEIISEGDNGLNNRVNKCIIGDMIPHDALDHFVPGTLLIVPANREGLIMSVLCGNLLDTEVVFFVNAIIFTGNKMPHEKVLKLIKQTHIPMLVVKEDSFSIATKINNMIIKVKSQESEKIAKTQELIEDYVDIDMICKSL
jgi:BioD-like phosphotransacetylase family protein